MCDKLSNRFIKRLSKILLGLLSLTLILQEACTHASENSKKLLRDVYRARIEYPTNSLVSQKLEEIIILLENMDAPLWQEKLEGLLSINVEMIFDDCFKPESETLCTPNTVGDAIIQNLPHTIADFGKSLYGNIWKLEKHNGLLSIKRIPSFPPQ